MINQAGFKLMRHIKTLCILAAIALGLGGIITPPTTNAQPLVTNGRIAFASNRDGDFEIYTINPDGTDLQQLTFNDTYDAYPDWSPDGQQLLFTSGQDGLSAVFIMDADGANQRNLTPDADGALARWSPDGASIYFLSDRVFPPRSAKETTPLLIYRMNIDGSNVTELFAVGPGVWGIDISPSGDQFAFASLVRTAAIFVRAFDGSDAVELVGGDDIRAVYPVWSPDGNQIAYVYGYNLAVMNVDGSNSAVISSGDASGEFEYLDW